MSDRKLRIGIIGIGWYAGTTLVPRLRETERVEIVAISRRDSHRLKMAQQELNIEETYVDWRKMLEKCELDAVVVSTPPNIHSEPTLAALDRGLHVFLEKPMSLASREAYQMAEAAEKTGLVLMVGYNARGMGSWRTVKHLLEKGAIGTLRQISVTMCGDVRFLWRGMSLPEEQQNLIPPSEFYSDVFKRGNWRTVADVVGGGMFADIGSHVQDLMLWLGDGSPGQVVSLAQNTGSPAIMNALAQLDNDVLISITFNDSVSGGEEIKLFSDGRMTFYGDEGQLTADWTQIMTTEAEHIWLTRDGERTRVETEFETVHPATAFVATVLDGAPNICKAREAARVVALTEAAYKSVAEGHVVTANCE